MILCEKPLAMNGPEGLKMVEAVEKAGVPNMVWYNYRRVPAVTLAKQLIDEGKLGRIFHYRAKFLQDWTIIPICRRAARASGGSTWPPPAAAFTGDLLAHCIDTALWLNGGIDTVNAMTETFVKERQAQPHGQSRESRHRRCLRLPGRFRTAPWRLSNRPATPAATRPYTPSRSTARHASIPGICTICTACNTSITGMKANLRGWRNDPCHRRRPPLHGPLVGARPADRLRTFVRASGRRLLRRPGQGQAGPARLPDALGHSLCATQCSTRRRAEGGRRWSGCSLSCVFAPKEQSILAWPGRARLVNTATPKLRRSARRHRTLQGSSDSSLTNTMPFRAWLKPKAPLEPIPESLFPCRVAHDPRNLTITRHVSHPPLPRRPGPLARCPRRLGSGP